ncbi:hypothetical protein [Azospirillum doebereinerae]
MHRPSPSLFVQPLAFRQGTARHPAGVVVRMFAPPTKPLQHTR